MACKKAENSPKNNVHNTYDVCVSFGFTVNLNFDVNDVEKKGG